MTSEQDKNIWTTLENLARLPGHEQSMSAEIAAHLRVGQLVRIRNDRIVALQSKAQGENFPHPGQDYQIIELNAPAKSSLKELERVDPINYGYSLRLADTSGRALVGWYGISWLANLPPGFKTK